LYLGSMQVLPQYPEHYPWLYATVVLVVGTVTAGCLWGRQLLRPHLRIVPGVVVGLVGIALWIGLFHLHLEQPILAYRPSGLRPQERHGFTPFDRLSHPAACWGFVAVRLLGLAVLVPVVEELFWRGFLLRWLISPDWQNQPIGQFSWFSFIGVIL